ncbi:Protein fluG [Cladobotryum mycophilum]|uniref:Glutamine synthetase n=1 Tax=Cladobotryum mycophilum TaxID=491253 RepID=A0ABR0SHA1_9HYPO
MNNKTAAGGQDALLSAIQNTPIIDHHAHALLRPEAISTYPFLSIASEAHDGIEASRTSLAHFRAVKQLSSVLGCDATWEAVEGAIEKKRAENYHGWTARCLSGIECVLVDDGLGGDELMAYNHFDTITPSASKRIVRIEQVAQRLIERACVRSTSFHDAFTTVILDFKAEIEQAILDPKVVGFKSVICYRTGLDIPAEQDDDKALEAFTNIFIQRKEPGAKPFDRLQHDGLNDYFVHYLANLIQDSPGKHKKPIQFHTGLGDNDITLTKASPAHLQPFIREYPTVPIVLLHSGYPFMREAGYLATMYPNVYADIGEVFPILSRDGQEAVVRQILELSPGSKVLWSTDGHYFPETYFLAVTQVREVLRTVLIEYVRKGDLTSEQAIRLVEDILFNNANKLYDLKLTLKKSTTALQLTPSDSRDRNLQLLSQFLEGKEAPKYLSLWWNDVMSAPRMRSVPIRRVWSMLTNGQDFTFGIATAYSGLMLNEMLVAGATATGEHRLIPDFTTLRPGPRKDHIMVMSNFTEKDGSLMPLCSRTILQRTLDKAASHGLTFDLGFEMELLFARRGESSYEGLGYPGHNASNVRAFEHEAVMEVIDDAIEKLDAAGVYIEMVHAESAPGQYEIVLPRAPALQAVEALLYTRDIVSSCAAAKGFRMTLHPKPFAMACGTAAHVHMSISSPNGSDPAVYEPFYAGILKHLRSIIAFTYSNRASYERAQDGCWAGGTWVMYGSQNREAPLRKVEGSHWEMKCMDGLANPYLAMAAVLSAGTHGVLDREELIWKDCATDPASLSDAQRQEFGIVKRLPRSIDESLDALDADKEMHEWMGEALVERYTAVKKAETEFLGSMDDEARKTWIMDRF